MFLNILIGIGAAIALFLIVVALRPARFRVSRSVTIGAPPEIPFEQVNNLQQWIGWSPWEKLDPAMKRTFEGPAAGVGAIYRWDGNSQVGAGINTIVESQQNQLIRFKLEMLRPFVGTNDVDFTFQPEHANTIVTWTMAGNLNFMTKAMDLIIGMDRMVGGQFDSGLTQLKQVSEAAHAA